MIKDTLKKLQGTFHFEHRDKDGNLKDTWEVKNLVTNAGFAQLALLAGDASAVPFTFLAVGTSSTAPAVGNTTLAAEITTGGLARVAGTVSRTTTTVTNDTYRITTTWTASASHTVEEVGVFNAASSGTMLARALTTSKAVTSGETLTGTYQLKFA
jgi:hypothetical protein